MSPDELLEKLSFAMPLGLGKAHAKAIERNLNANAQSCLDIGCGRGSFKFLKKFDSVGCDIYLPGLIKARKKAYYKNLVQGDVKQLPFKPKSFDAAICVEVIEHLDKASGIKLIQQMEEIAAKQVIIMTPWGYLPMEKREDNPYLTHHSGWLPREFQEMGYKTYHFYYFRYPLGSKKYQIITRYILTLVLYPMIRLFPNNFAQDFVAVKDFSISAAADLPK